MKTGPIGHAIENLLQETRAQGIAIDQIALEQRTYMAYLYELVPDKCRLVGDIDGVKAHGIPIIVSGNPQAIKGTLYFRGQPATP